MIASVRGWRAHGVGLVASVGVAAAACGGQIDAPPTETSPREPTTATTGASLRRAVDPERELVITDPSVIESPEETTFDPSRPSGTHRRGAWSFGRLLHDMLPKRARGDARAASELATRWLSQWETSQSPNPAASPSDARPTIRALVLGPWRVASGCAESDDACVLDMAKAPFRLVAIVNRPDLRIVADDDSAIGGEGRFVFQLVGPTLGWAVPGGPVVVTDPTPRPQKFMVIFEYSLPVRTRIDTVRWADRWHALGAIPFGDRYNAALHAITNDFSGPDADVRRPNGNALDQLRTNEVATQGARRFGADLPLSAPQIWELREFRLGAAGLVQHTVNLEPSRDFDIARPASIATFRAPFGTRSPELGSWLVGNREAVLAGQHTIPSWMAGNSSLVGSGGFGPWGKLSTTAAHSFFTADVPAVRVGDDVRDELAIGTCAGCHRHETGTPHFMHLADRRSIDAVDQATLGLPPATTSVEERATVLSAFLQHEIARPSAELPSGGPRYADFTALVEAKPSDVVSARGRRPCR